MDRSAVRVLVLDDEPFIRKLHAHILRGMGFASCQTFETGPLALVEVDRGPAPDLILLDLSMPEMDGIEFIRHLVQRKYAGRLILVSGEDKRLLQTAERLVQAHGMNILGRLSKPARPSELQTLIENWESRTAFIPRPVPKTYAAEQVLAAIRNRELVNHYQPKVLARTGEIVGVESLARWQHPTDGLVLPSRFIGIAEQHGLIDELTRALFTRALGEIGDLTVSGFPSHVSINLAATTLASVDFADFASDATLRASMSPHNVVLEVTESQIISDQRAPLDVLTRLRLKRFKLSIDDFGTGYSSLAQLRDIPFDELKIDQSFVHRASHDKTARAMYDASLGLSRQLGLTTVAEGVEDRADWDLVQSTGCDIAQGYFIARPMPASALPAWREVWRARCRDEFASSW